MTDPKERRFIYGVNPVIEALRAGRTVHEVWIDAKRADLMRKLGPRLEVAHIPLHSSGKDVLFNLVQTRHHQGVVAETDPLPILSFDEEIAALPEEALVLVLDRIQDPQNLGSIYRSADGAGVDLIVLPAKKCASHQLSSVAKASAGAVEHVPTAVVKDLVHSLEALQAASFTVDVIEANGENYRDATFGSRVALVVGSEGYGVSYNLRQLADRRLAIAMQGKVNSLNVGVATAVLLFALRNRPSQSPSA